MIYLTVELELVKVIREVFGQREKLIRVLGVRYQKCRDLQVFSEIVRGGGRPGLVEAC
jgi:hypothetical protein